MEFLLQGDYETDSVEASEPLGPVQRYGMPTAAIARRSWRDKRQLQGIAGVRSVHLVLAIAWSLAFSGEQAFCCNLLRFVWFNNWNY